MKDSIDLLLELAESVVGIGERSNRARYLELLASDDESPHMREAMASMSSCALTWLGLVQELLEREGCSVDRRLTDPYVIGEYGGPAVTYAIGIARDCGGYESLPSRMPHRGEAAYVALPDGSGGEHVIACILEEPDALARTHVIHGGQWTSALGNCILKGSYAWRLEGEKLFAGSKRVFGLIDTRKVLSELDARLRQAARDQAVFDLARIGEQARGAALEHAFAHSSLTERETLPPPEDS